MKLFEAVEAPVSNLNTLGTVAENIGAKGTIELDANNLGRADKLVMVTLSNGTAKQVVYCSAALSAQVRKDKMKKQDLINYLGSLQIAETTNEEGEKRFKIVLNQGEKISGTITATHTPKTLQLDEIPW